MKCHFQLDTRVRANKGVRATGYTGCHTLFAWCSYPVLNMQSQISAVDLAYTVQCCSIPTGFQYTIGNYTNMLHYRNLIDSEVAPCTLHVCTGQKSTMSLLVQYANSVHFHDFIISRKRAHARANRAIAVLELCIFLIACAGMNASVLLRILTSTW